MICFLFQVIVYPTEKSLKRCGALMTLGGIWLAAIFISLPNFIWRTLETHEINLPTISYISFCFEEWPTEYGRAAYSAIVMLLQYCLPILTLVLAHARICNRLRDRMIHSGHTSTPAVAATSSSSSPNKTHRRGNRMRKTKKLLIMIAVIFCLSWLPLNLYNIIVDIHNPFSDTEVMFLTYAICHMIGMSSACSNPLLYGWLNHNFKKEFFEIFSILFPCCCTPIPSPIALAMSSGRTSCRQQNLSVLEIYPESLKKSDRRRCRRKKERLQEKLKRDMEDSSSYELQESSSSFDSHERWRKEKVSLLSNGRVTTTVV